MRLEATKNARESTGGGGGDGEGRKREADYFLSPKADVSRNIADIQCSTVVSLNGRMTSTQLAMLGDTLS